MRGMICAVVMGCLFTLPATAASSLQGEWKVTFPELPGHVATAKIDAEGRTIWVDDDGRYARGYIAHHDSLSVEFVTISTLGVSRIQCSIQSTDLLHCRGKYTDGRAFKSTPILTRTERPGPKSLIPAR